MSRTAPAPTAARYYTLATICKSASAALKREDLKDRPPNMWRYFEVMPVLDEANVVTLGEGFTPIFKTDRLATDTGCSSLFIKDEGLNPTASFKARGLGAAVSKAKELGITKLTMPSAGNAAGAMTAYAAKAGMEAYVFMPKDAPEANRVEVEISGANLELVDGYITDAGRISAQRAEELGLFDVSTLREPYRVEGKKTMGYEIAEQMGWTLPDIILYPTGGGTGIVGMWKAFSEMETMGWIDGKRPKMFAVQSEGCAPIVRAFNEGTEFAEPWREPGHACSRHPCSRRDWRLPDTAIAEGKRRWRDHGQRGRNPVGLASRGFP